MRSCYLFQVAVALLCINCTVADAAEKSWERSALVTFHRTCLQEGETCKKLLQSNEFNEVCGEVLMEQSPFFQVDRMRFSRCDDLDGMKIVCAEIDNEALSRLSRSVVRGETIHMVTDGAVLVSFTIYSTKLESPFRLFLTEI